MSAAKSILAATKANSADVFTAFKAHCDAPRVETRSAVLTQLRNAYPDHHVTEAKRSSVSLFEFAAAEKALLNFDDEGESFQATRDWKSVGEGIEKKVHAGSLRDDFRFARFQYIWEDSEYLVYYVQWQDMFKPADKIFYILYPRTASNIISGHCLESDALVLAAGKWTSQLHGEIFVFDDGHWEKSKELWKSVNGASWTDVILAPEMKNALIEDVQGFFDYQQLYAQFAVPWKRGIILHGVPGNGKTISIKALMNALYTRPRDGAIPSLYVKSFETNCNTEQFSIRAIFQKARDMAPCLLVFEDLDSLVKDEIRSYFLNEVDGLESNEGILMIGSTNHLDRLDPAIAKRPSRFDRKYLFEMPGEEQRRLYAEYWRGKLLRNETVDFPEELVGVVARLTEGFSFAYLKELFVMALLGLVRGVRDENFEMVDGGEGASADGDGVDTNDEDDNGDGADEEGVDTVGLCTCAKICSTCNKALAIDTNNTPADKKDDDATKAGGQAENHNISMPTVDIPQHLADSLLLRVIRQQIRILHAEMDSTKQGAWPSGKKGVPGGTQSGAYAEQMRQLRRANANRRAG